MPTPSQTAKAIKSLTRDTFPNSKQFLQDAEATYGPEATRNVVDYIESTLGITTDMPAFSGKAAEAFSTLEAAGRIAPKFPKEPASTFEQAKQVLTEAREGTPAPVAQTAVEPFEGIAPFAAVGRARKSGQAPGPEPLQATMEPPKQLGPAPSTPSGVAPPDEVSMPAAPAAPAGPGRAKTVAGGLAAGTALAASLAGDQGPPPPPPSAPTPPTSGGAAAPSGAPANKAELKAGEEAMKRPDYSGLLKGVGVGKLVELPAPPTGAGTTPTYKDRSELDRLADAARGELVKDTNEAMDQLKEAKSDLRKQEIWERVIKGVSHLLAGWYGQKHNVPITNVDIPLTDFSRKEQLALEEHGAALRAAAARHAARKEEMEELGRSVEDFNRNEDRRVATNRALWEDAMKVAVARNSQLMDKARLSFDKARTEMEAESRESEFDLKMRELDIREKSAVARGDTATAKALATQAVQAQKLKDGVGEELGKSKGADSQDKTNEHLIKARYLNNEYYKLTGSWLVAPEVQSSTNPDDWTGAFFKTTAPQEPSEPAAAAPAPAGVSGAQSQLTVDPEREIEIKIGGVSYAVPKENKDAILKAYPGAEVVTAKQ